MPGLRGASCRIPLSFRRAPLPAALVVAVALGGAPRAALALLGGEVPSHSRLFRQNCITPKDFTVLKWGGTYYLYSIKVDRTLPASQNTNVFMRQHSSGNLQSWVAQPDEALENPPRTGWDDNHIWAPHIVERSGLFHMFYTGVQDGTVQFQRMGVRTATNLAAPAPWNAGGTDPATPVFQCNACPTGMPWNCSNGDFRDPFVMRNPNANNWLMFYAARRANGVMGIGVGVSGSDASGNPLVGGWTDGGELVDDVAKYGGNLVESPHFFQHGITRYMLFTGRCVTGEACFGGGANPTVDGIVPHLLTTESAALTPSLWVNRGTLTGLLGADYSLHFATEYVKDPDTGEEFLGSFRQSQDNAPGCWAGDSGNVEFRRIIWDVDPANPWKFKLADPNPPGFWTQQTPSGAPSARDQAGMTLDTKRHRLMLFGGYGSTGAKNDYWTYTLSLTPAWSNWSPGGTAPSVRNRPGVVYDPVGDRMIVFGGFAGGGVGTPLTDAYELTGLETFPTWAPITASGGPSMITFGTETVFDPVRNRAIVVDGIGRVWALSLPSGQAPTWTTLQNSGGLTTAGALFFNLVYDSKHDRLLAFGGWLAVQGSNNSLNGVQAFPLSGPNANTWTTITVSGTPPSKRSLSAGIYDPVRDRLVIHGGQMPGDGSGALYADDWQLSYGTNPNTGTWTQLSVPTSVPTARGGHVAAYDPTEDRLIAFGGRTGAATWVNQTWSRSWGEGGPWQITDLNWEVHCTSIDFSWTAPRDDKANASDFAGDNLPIAGNASTFEVRRHTQKITNANWYSAQVVASGTSAAAGTQQIASVTEPTCLTSRYYAVKTFDNQNRESWASNSTAQTSCPGSGGPPYCWESATAGIDVLPKTMALEVRGANPARGQVRITYDIPGGAGGKSYELSVFDVAGRLVSKLDGGDANPGSHEQTWSPTHLASGTGAGVYFVRFRLGEDVLRRTIVVQ